MFLTATLILLLLDIRSISANQCSMKSYETIIRGGPSLPSCEIISRHNITSSDVVLGCHTHCKNEKECVGFNYRTTKNVENCQLTNVNRKKEETKTGDWILMRDIEAVLHSDVWKLVARFSNRDGENWIKDANFWFDKTSPYGSTTDPFLNKDMISEAFWEIHGNEIKITRSDDPTHTALLETTNNCLNGKTFRQFITCFGNFRNGAVWSNNKCLGSCEIKYGGLYQSTTGFGMHNCSSDIQRNNSIGFWCNWGADGAVMMIGGGGDDCRRADHGIGLTEEDEATFGGSEPFVDFGDDLNHDRNYEGKEVPTSYALNLWIR
ncbi:uncharacterized protein LOC114526088 [Dendronephthya gigantea]|uniref:uncharacterized protein LOC114526088 n=1 Tax=Dendronephthya gigantea TaxID=151771 RepID=UPI00106C2CDD|nr:uncharacterized protein LOC114526088 [Dendronephthya gigantea]